MFQDRQKSFFHLPVRREVVEIYHDESYDIRGHPFCHQFLVVPLYSKRILNQALQCKRLEFRATSPLTINWKKLRKRMNKNRNLVAEHWISLLSKGMSNQPFSYLSQRKPQCFKENLGLKIGTFAGGLSNSFWAHLSSDEEKTRRKYETLLRMGIKGCLHYCFNPEFTNYAKVKIKKFYTDAYVFGEISLDNERILGRLEEGLRDYIELEEDLKIEHVEKSKKKTPEVNLEELTDLILGATRYICTDCKKKDWLDKIVIPLERVYRKKERGKGFKHSSHFRSFTIGTCKIDENENLNFKEWRPKRRELSIDEYNKKLKL